MSSCEYRVLSGFHLASPKQLSGMQPPACPSLALSADGRLLLMAADQAIKVWDCWAQARPRCQVCPKGQGGRKGCAGSLALSKL